MRWLLAIVFSIILFVLPATAFAQNASNAPITGSPSCDLCGFCAGGTKPTNWETCHTCLYDTNGGMQPNNYWTVAGCLSTKPEKFVQSILSIVFAVSGGLAFMAFLAGSAMVLTSGGDPGKLNNGKSIIVSSVFGLLLILFSIFLLRFVGVEILRIPGFG